MSRKDSSGSSIDRDAHILFGECRQSQLTCEQVCDYFRVREASHDAVEVDWLPDPLEQMLHEVDSLALISGDLISRALKDLKGFWAKQGIAGEERK